MVDIVKGGVRSLPTLTRMGWFYSHAGMFARKWSLPLCVLCGKTYNWTFMSKKPILSWDHVPVTSYTVSINEIREVLNLFSNLQLPYNKLAPKPTHTVQLRVRMFVDIHCKVSRAVNISLLTNLLCAAWRVKIQTMAGKRSPAKDPPPPITLPTSQPLR